MTPEAAGTGVPAEAVEAAAEAIVALKRPSQHGQDCPIWVKRKKVPRLNTCDCWILPEARVQAAAATPPIAADRDKTINLLLAQAGDDTEAHDAEVDRLTAERDAALALIRDIGIHDRLTHGPLSVLLADRVIALARGRWQGHPLDIPGGSR